MTTVQLNLGRGFGIGVVLGLATAGGVVSSILLCKSGLLKGICKSNSTGATFTATTCSSVYNQQNSGTGEAQDSEGLAPERDAFWFTENLSPFFGYKLAMKRILFEGKSDFQRVQVIETSQFGKTLVMDGQTQSAQLDEHVYHESLVHPAMLLHPSPKKVFIGGGGEFATAREVLRHSSVEKCVMVDIDKLACDICREQLPEWNAGAYEDKRFSVFYDDAKKWLEDNEERFDVIILDICDPIEAGPGYKLYTKDFYEFLRSRLTPNGVVVTQSGPGAVFNVQEECFTVINNTLTASFKTVLPYVVDIPSFGCVWGYNLATNGDLFDLAMVCEKKISEVDEMISGRIKSKLKFLDGVSFRGLFGIAKSIREKCEKETRVMTIENPVFMYAS